MNRFFKRILFGMLRWRYRREVETIEFRTLFRQAKNLRATLVHWVSDSFFMAIGVVSAAFGLKGFLLPNTFIDGGVTGISLLIAETTNLSLSLLIVVINLPFIIMGYSQLSRQFAFKSIIAIVALATVVHFVDFPIITSDKLLIAVFGGFFLGAGIGLAIRGGAVLDGTEVLAIYLSKKTGLTIGDIILLFNIIIFAFGAYVLSIEIALYAILTYIAASKTIDYVIEGVEEYTGITIISDQSEQLRSMIVNTMGRGVTIYKGMGGYRKPGGVERELEIVFTVVTRLEIARLRTEIDKIDPKAFIIMNSIKDTKGGMIKKRPLKK